jgi:hypothetical protein
MIWEVVTEVDELPERRAITPRFTLCARDLVQQVGGSRSDQVLELPARMAAGATAKEAAKAGVGARDRKSTRLNSSH